MSRGHQFVPHAAARMPSITEVKGIACHRHDGRAVLVSRHAVSGRGRLSLRKGRLHESAIGALVGRVRASLNATASNAARASRPSCTTRRSFWRCSWRVPSTGWSFARLTSRSGAAILPTRSGTLSRPGLLRRGAGRNLCFGLGRAFILAGHRCRRCRERTEVRRLLTRGWRMPATSVPIPAYPRAIRSASSTAAGRPGCRRESDAAVCSGGRSLALRSDWPVSPRTRVTSRCCRCRMPSPR